LLGVDVEADVVFGALTEDLFIDDSGYFNAFDQTPVCNVSGSNRRPPPGATCACPLPDLPAAALH